MKTVDRVLAFAVQNPDYWNDLLSGDDYPKELSDKEQQALAAARTHIQEAVVTLLTLCATSFFSKLGETRARKKRFSSVATARKRLIELNPPVGTDKKLYRLEIALWGESSPSARVELWVSLVAKKNAMPVIQSELKARGVACSVSDYHISAVPIPLAEQDAFQDLANLAADRLKQLVQGVK
jgi:hypothetical protein